MLSRALMLLLSVCIISGCEKLKNIADDVASDADKKEEKKKDPSVAAKGGQGGASTGGNTPPPNVDKPKTLAEALDRFYKMPSPQRNETAFQTLVANIEELKELGNVEELNLGNTPITPGMCGLLPKFTALKKLILGKAKGEIDFDPIAKLKTLEYLDLKDTPTTDDDVAQIAGLPLLKTLNLSNTKITDRGVAAIGHSKSLLELSIASNLTVKGTGFGAWKPGPAIRILRASQSHFGVAGPGSIGKNNTLRELYANDTRMPDSQAAYVGQMRALEKIALSGNYLSDAGTRFIAALPAYKWVELSGNVSLTNKTLGWFALARNNRLEDIYVERTKIQGSAIPLFLQKKPKAAVWWNGRAWRKP